MRHPKPGIYHLGVRRDGGSDIDPLSGLVLWVLRGGRGWHARLDEKPDVRNRNGWPLGDVYVLPLKPYPRLVQLLYGFDL